MNGKKAKPAMKTKPARKPSRGGQIQDPSSTNIGNVPSNVFHNAFAKELNANNIRSVARVSKSYHTLATAVAHARSNNLKNLALALMEDQAQDLHDFLTDIWANREESRTGWTAWKKDDFEVAKQTYRSLIVPSNSRNNNSTKNNPNDMVKLWVIQPSWIFEKVIYQLMFHGGKSSTDDFFEIEIAKSLQKNGYNVRIGLAKRSTKFYDLVTGVILNLIDWGVFPEEISSLKIWMNDKSKLDEVDTNTKLFDLLMEMQNKSIMFDLSNPISYAVHDDHGSKIYEFRNGSFKYVRTKRL